MKKVYSLLAGFLISVSASVSAQTMQSFNPGNDPVSWGSPNESLPGNVYVSRYGYWRNQPVKMAYWTSLPHYQIPPFFHLSNAEGKIVYTGRPVWMRTPENAMVPVGILYPGARIYALNFSGFHDPGTYYIEMPGYPSSLRSSITSSFKYGAIISCVFNFSTKTFTFSIVSLCAPLSDNAE